MKEFKRKEVRLSTRVIERLQQLADKKKWSLKKYMEITLFSASLRAKKLNKYE